MDEKTELEKRWETEDEEESTIEFEPKFELGSYPNVELDPVYGGEVAEEMDPIGAEDEEMFVKSPLADSLPLVLVTNNNRVFIGGLLNVVEGGVILDHPMAYVEISDQRNPGRVQIGIQKVYHGLSVPVNMWFKHDSLNMLHVDEEQSLRLRDIYKNTFDQLQAAEAGITAPSVNDLEAYARKKGQ